MVKKIKKTKKLFSLFVDIFKTSYCQDLSDSLWKSRMNWIDERAEEIPAGSSVLDVGAGEVLHYKSFDHCKYVTQDFVQTPNLAYGKIDIVSDITKIPVQDESFDVILCTEVFEHVPYPIEALKELTRILKPGGTLLFSAPLGSGQHQQPYHFYGGYTRFWYEKFFPENRLEIKSIAPNGGLFGHIVELLWRSRPTMIEYLDKKRYLKILKPFIQVSLYNFSAVVLWQLEKYKIIEDFTVCFFVIANKMSKK